MTRLESSSEAGSAADPTASPVLPAGAPRARWSSVTPLSTACPRLLAAVVCLAAVVSESGAFPSTQTTLGRTLEQLTTRYSGSVVTVRAVRPTGPDPGIGSVPGSRSIGPTCSTLLSTGLVVDARGHVLTCVDGAQPTDSLLIVTLGGVEIPAAFVSQDVRTGLTLIAPRRSPAGVDLQPVGRTASAPMRERDWIVVLVADPEVGAFEPRIGRLEAIVPATISGGVTVFEIDAEKGRGGCGAPVLDGNGDLVGMIVDCELMAGNVIDASTRRGHSLRALPRGLLFETAVLLERRAGEARGFLGVQTTLRSLAEADLESAPVGPSPVEVRRVLPGSPAEQAGLLAGDLLLSLDGVSVQDVNQVSERISLLKPGSVATLVVLRGGVRLRLEAVIGDRSSLEWMERSMLRSARLASWLEEEIEAMQEELDEIRDLQERFR